MLDAEEKVKSEIKSDLKKSIVEDTKMLHEELVETRVREAVTAAVNSNAPSKVLLARRLQVARLDLGTVRH